MNRLIAGRVGRVALAAAAGGALAWAGLALSAWAAPFAAQLRFNVQPGAADPMWKAHPGVTFQKSGECVYSASPTPSTAWPVSPSLVRGGGKATAPVFNPGFAQPDGSYLPNSNDDGFNTLFYPAEAAQDAKTIVCRATLLANGKDITAEQGRIVSQTLASIGAAGPPTVSPKVDPQKLAMALPLPPSRPPAGGVRTVAPKVVKQGAGVPVAYGGPVDLDGDGKPDLGLHEYKPGGESNAIAFNTQYGADVSMPKGTPRGSAGCKAADYPAGAKIVVQNSWYCVKTTGGHVAEFHIDAVSVAGGKAVVKVSYSVWGK